MSRNDFILIGFSAGGPVVFKYASANKVKAVVGIAIPYQVADGDDLKKFLPKWKEKGHLIFKSSKLGKAKLPYEYYIAAKEFNILEYAKDITCPKLFIAGTDDVNVPKESTEKAYNACLDTKKLIIIDGMDHKYKESVEITNKVNKKVLEFIKKH